LLLPDQHFRSHSGANDLLITAIDLLSDHDVVAAAYRVEDPDVLRREGALTLEGPPGKETVVAAEDKPADTSGYNAVWAAVACRPSRVPDLVDLCEPTATSPLLGAPAIMVTGYRNVSRPDEL
jgi:hypothetical protein